MKMEVKKVKYYSHLRSYLMGKSYLSDYGVSIRNRRPGGSERKELSTQTSTSTVSIQRCSQVKESRDSVAS
jgi:hypothetical protein